MRREELATAQCGIDALPGERIEEISGVSNQRSARRPGVTRSAGKGTRRAHRSDSFRALESLGEVWARCNPLLEERSLVFSDLFCPRLWYDHGDVHQAITDFDYSEIAVVVDVHLAHVGDALNFSVMRHQRDAARPDSTRFDEAKPSSDYRAQAVRADDVASVDHTRSSIDSDRLHAGDTLRSIAGDVSNAQAFFDPRSRGASPAQHDFIENGTANGEALVSESVEAVIGGELPVGDQSVGSAHPHSREMRRVAALDLVEHSNVRQDSRCLWAQILRADLVPRESGAIDHQHIGAFSRQRPRR